MKNWRMKLAQLMQGRYGPDGLYKALLAFFLGLTVLNLLVRSNVLYFASLGVFIYAIYRVLSKDRSKRAAENQRYMALQDKWKKKLLQTRNRLKEYKTHRYRVCPSCKTTLRLSKRVGIMHVKCPKCSTEFDVKIRY